LAAGVLAACGELWSHCVSWAALTVPAGIDHGAARLALGNGWPDQWPVSRKAGQRTESRSVRELVPKPPRPPSAEQQYLASMAGLGQAVVAIVAVLTRAAAP
jgi:hypothetical protein